MTSRSGFSAPACGIIVALAVLAGCAGERRTAPVPAVDAIEAHRLIERALPPAVPDRVGWRDDIYAALAALALVPTRENICATVAVIEQESGFQVDPVIPGLPAIAWREIDARAAHAGVPRMLVHAVLEVNSRTGESYAARLDRARTEKELSDVYEDFIAAVPMGRTLFADRNPIRTRGPMQVQATFAEQFAATRPYPYPVKGSIADEVFSRRGGVYFGIAHLLAYAAPYDRYVFRFADFNAGRYASRNAAFQAAVTAASGIPLIDDGALLPNESDSPGAGATELALRVIARRLEMRESAIHAALLDGKTPQFEQSPLYARVFALAERAERRPLPRAKLPRIDLHGPKITRKLTTEWYANRVNRRFETCLHR